MKRLRNRETGQVFETIQPVLGGDGMSITELSEKWEDVPEETKKYWFIDFNGEVKEFELLGFEWQGCMREIGNYFETKEEAEKAVEKLKAWKRLKDLGFKFCKYAALAYGEINFRIPDFEGWNNSETEQVRKDMDLLFGGAEWIEYEGKE